MHLVLMTRLTAHALNRDELLRTIILFKGLF